MSLDIKTALNERIRLGWSKNKIKQEFIAVGYSEAQFDKIYRELVVLNNDVDIENPLPADESQVALSESSDKFIGYTELFKQGAKSTYSDPKQTFNFIIGGVGFIILLLVLVFGLWAFIGDSTTSTVVVLGIVALFFIGMIRIITGVSKNDDVKVSVKNNYTVTPIKRYLIMLAFMIISGAVFFGVITVVFIGLQYFFTGSFLTILIFFALILYLLFWIFRTGIILHRYLHGISRKSK